MERWFAQGGRGVDTAWMYNNQIVVGWALGNTSQPLREDVFVTSKVPCVGTAEGALKYIKQDLAQLAVPQVDLMLIHSPAALGCPPGLGRPCCVNASDIQATWKGLEQALAQNLTRAIGVSNFAAKDIKAVTANGATVPSVNQARPSRPRKRPR